LGHQDQGARRRLRHAQAVEHLARREPAVSSHRLLGDKGQNRIGAAEGDHGHLGEEHSDFGEDMIPAQQRQQQRRRSEPEEQENRRRR